MSSERRARLATIVLVTICGLLGLAVLLNWFIGAADAH